MRTKRYLLLFLSILCCFLIACGAGGDQSQAAPDDSGSEESAGPDEDGSEETEEPEEEAAADEDKESPAEISERAMENFLAKLEEGNYVIHADDYLKTTVFSRDQVWFDYAEDMYDDFAVVSVDDESFQGYLTADGLTEVSYLGEGQAIEAAKEKLPNIWTDENVSGGNIYNLFYNSQEEPLTFVSHEDAVKQSLAGFTGIGSAAARLMHEVFLVLDNEDPSVVHLQAEIDDDPVARMSFDDVDLVISFGDAESEPSAEAWMSDPVYPEAEQEWSESDKFILNSVFLPGYGEAALPFPSFASYAFKIDEENFVSDDEVRIRDPRATEEDMDEYISLLLNEGFSGTEETGEDGTVRTYYRRILREDYKCYTSVDLQYNDGVDLVAKKYYDFPVCDGLDEINGVIGSYGFTALPDSSNFTSVKGTDRANELTESWLYFFDYDLVLYVNIEFGDSDELLAYLEDYEKTLPEAGFEPVRLNGDEEIDRYESSNGLSSFKYHFEDDGTVSLLYKAEHYITPEEAEAKIAEAGFPAIDLADNAISRDLKAFRKVQYGLDNKAFLTVGETFESAGEAEDYLSRYEEALNAAGFDRENPAVAGSNKQVALVNEEKGFVIGIDFFENEDGGATVNMDFCAE